MLLKTYLFAVSGLMLLGAILKCIILSTKEYPYTKSVKRWEDVLVMVSGILWGLWAYFLIMFQPLAHTFLWVTFSMDALGILCFALLISFAKYPRTETRHAVTHVITLMLNLAFVLWGVVTLVGVLNAAPAALEAVR